MEAPPAAVAARAAAPLTAEAVMLRNQVGSNVANAMVRVKEVLRNNLAIREDEPFGDEQDIFEFGMDSLSTITIRQGLCSEFGVAMSAGCLFDCPTPLSLAREIAQLEPVAESEAAPGPGPASRPSFHSLPPPALAAFTQLVWDDPMLVQHRLYMPVGGHHQYSRYRRNTDGMECVLIPAALVLVGDGLDGRACLPNEAPCHGVRLSSFLMDIEPVSAGAYARFLNAAEPPQEALRDWCLLRAGDRREPHLPLRRSADGRWRLAPGVPPEWPMIMVSWFGANAYSLWANGCPWQSYHSAEAGFLPTEAQWEYAARGPEARNFPWGDSPASPDLLNVWWDDGASIDPEAPLSDFPLRPVNAQLGVSRFQLRGMAGNVWQWCRDAWDPNFYKTKEAKQPNAWNDDLGEPPRSERGGSWVGPASVARSSYRRGRAAKAKGRCLGFRCVGVPAAASASDVSTTCSEAGSADVGSSQLEATSADTTGSQPDTP